MMTFRTPSDISDERARCAAVAALAKQLGVDIDRACAMAVELSRQRGITFEEAIKALQT